MMAVDDGLNKGQDSEEEGRDRKKKSGIAGRSLGRGKRYGSGMEAV